jgi:hypothetical protein
MVSVFYSCSKNNNPTPEPYNSGSTYTADEMALWRQLNNFNQKIKTGLKSEEFITPDSAMWYLEALFNVQQATDTTFEDSKTYERTYSFNVNTNGTVNMSEVVNVYNQLLEDLNAELGQLETEYKFLYVADLEQESLKAGSFTMTLTAGLGFNPLVWYYAITPTDDWYYGNWLGHCDDGGTGGNSDAGQELKRRFNHPYIAYPFPIQHNSINTGWISIDHSRVLDYLETPEYANRIFHQTSTTPPCIDYLDLQYYLTQGHYMIYNYPTDTPTGEHIAGLDFKYFDMWTNNPNPPNNIYVHHYQIWYGIPVQIPPIED